MTKKKKKINGMKEYKKQRRETIEASKTFLNDETVEKIAKQRENCMGCRGCVEVILFPVFLLNYILKILLFILISPLFYLCVSKHYTFCGFCAVYLCTSKICPNFHYGCTDEGAKDLRDDIRVEFMDSLK